jgi:hypothetical protein
MKSDIDFLAAPPDAMIFRKKFRILAAPPDDMISEEISDFEMKTKW